MIITRMVVTDDLRHHELSISLLAWDSKGQTALLDILFPKDSGSIYKICHTFLGTGIIVAVCLSCQLDKNKNHLKDIPLEESGRVLTEGGRSVLKVVHTFMGRQVKRGLRKKQCLLSTIVAIVLC